MRGACNFTALPATFELFTENPVNGLSREFESDRKGAVANLAWFARESRRRATNRDAARLDHQARKIAAARNLGGSCSAATLGDTANTNATGNSVASG
jgi:hypothetical protein